MAWLFKSDWVTNPRNPTNSDLDNIAKDIKTWGGDVDGGAHKLLNVSQVGIGGANRATFDINGPVAFTNSANLAGGGFDFTASAWTTLGGGIIGWNKATGEGDFSLVSISGGGADGGFSFWDRNTKLVRILKNGNVGLGTGSPTGPLSFGNPQFDATPRSWAASDLGNIAFYQAQNWPTSNYYGRILDLVAGGGGQGSWIRFHTAGTAGAAPALRMLIDKDGNVGINQTSPARLLHVTDQNSGNTQVVVSGSSTPGRKTGITYRIDSSDLWEGYCVNTGSRYDFRFEYTTSPVLTLASNGNVGIGTNSPQAKFQVLASTVDPANNKANSAMLFWDATGGGDATAWSGFGTDAAGALWFHAWGDKYLRFNSVGWLGVNTVPASAFHVYGSVSSDQLRITDDNGGTNVYKIGRNNATGILDFTGTQGGGTAYRFNAGPLIFAVPNYMGVTNGTVDGWVPNSGMTMWMDEAANKLTIRVRYSSGALHYAQINLT